MTVATVAHYKNIYFQLKVEDLAYIQTVADIASVLMEVNECLMLLRVFLFDEPAMQRQLILRDNPDILI